ncbi:MAG: TetR family transcriptional regulator [Actinomycetia bacterium]|nr:TetR family transcriptional regulator [Actinomycetes bacterium]
MGERSDADRALAAARDEFTKHGFRDATVGQITERAGLTRGAVDSCFPSKRALYFAVLAQAAAEAPGPPYPPTARTASAALADFARAWMARLPLATDGWHGASHLDRDLVPEILSSEAASRAFSQLTSLSAIVVGLAMEQLDPKKAATRMVRAAGTALTALHGARQLAAAAPGFGEPFAVARICEELADLDLGDGWAPAHLPYVSPALAVDQRWDPPPVRDALRGDPAELTGDGVVAILGLHRLAAVEEAWRAVPAGAAVTAVLVTDSPGELGALARFVVSDLGGCLRAAVPPAAWPSLRIVHDESGAVAAAAGVAECGDATQTAVRIRAGRIVARADGYGACHAAASA